MRHTESSIQQACVRLFRTKYPWAARLLIHVKNEEAGGAAAGGIHKAEGVVAGAPDLLLLIPSRFRGADRPFLGIEMKSETGRVRESQALYAACLRTTGAEYEVCRSLEQFEALTGEYMAGVGGSVRQAMTLAWRAGDAERLRKAREELKRHAVGSKPTRTPKSVSAARNELKTLLS